MISTLPSGSANASDLVPIARSGSNFAVPVSSIAAIGKSPSLVLSSSAVSAPSPTVTGNLPSGLTPCAWTLKTDGKYYPLAAIDPYNDPVNSPTPGGTLLWLDRVWHSDASLTPTPGKTALHALFHRSMVGIPSGSNADDRALTVFNWSDPSTDPIPRGGSSYAVYSEMGILSTPPLSAETNGTVAGAWRSNTYLNAPKINITSVSVTNNVATIVAANTLNPVAGHVCQVYITGLFNANNTWLNNTSWTVVSANSTSFTIAHTIGNYTATSDTGVAWFVAIGPWYGVGSTLEISSGSISGASPAAASFWGQISCPNFANLAPQSFLVSYFASFLNDVGTIGGNYAGFYAQAPPNRGGTNWGFYSGDFGTNINDWNVRSISSAANSGANLFQGPVVFGPHGVLRSARFGGSAPGNTDAVGQLAFAGTTTASYVFTEGYTVAPAVFIQPNVPGATTFTISALSTSGFTVTASASFSGTVSYFTVGLN